MGWLHRRYGGWDAWINKADCHKSRAPSKQQQTDQWTDRPTNQPTKKADYRVACKRLKRGDLRLSNFLCYVTAKQKNLVT